MRAGTLEARGYPLRCPVCKAGVYHRNGVYNRPHFAHFSGNANRACELYHPDVGGLGTNSNSSHRPPLTTGFEPPALIWSDDKLASLSLRLRLPRVPDGYASTLTISSSRGVRSFAGAELSRPAFVTLPLRDPPAKVQTSPSDPSIEMRLEAVLSQFRLSGNYFRVTANGGILEGQDAALELGEEYFYVSQRSLRERYPAALKISRRQEHGQWFVYRVHLRDNPTTYVGDVEDLRICLDRRVVPPKPRLDIVWPPAYRFDDDGKAIFARTKTEFIVRSTDGPPAIKSGNQIEATTGDLGRGFYRIELNVTEEEAVIFTTSGAVQWLRFESVRQAIPSGVVITAPGGSVDIASPKAEAIACEFGPVEITVPSELLWRNVRLNGRKINPLPNGEVHILEGPLHDINFGAFGSIFRQETNSSSGVIESQWYRKIEMLVAMATSYAAMDRLKSARSKHQATRWAVENNAISILPLVLSALSAEVSRDIP